MVRTMVLDGKKALVLDDKNPMISIPPLQKSPCFASTEVLVLLGLLAADAGGRPLRVPLAVPSGWSFPRHDPQELDGFMENAMKMDWMGYPYYFSQLLIGSETSC